MKFWMGIFFLMGFVSGVYGDTIYLKNGKILKGKIINQSKTKVQIRINERNLIIEKKQIRKIQFENLEALRRKREEERRKQEELRRKREEERRKQEELRRKREEERRKQEELRRKQEEERKKREQQKKLRFKLRKGEELYIYLRSAILPGWGHYEIGETSKSYLWGGLFFGFLMATIAQRNDASYFQKIYEKDANEYFFWNQVSGVPEIFLFYLNQNVQAKKDLTITKVKRTNQLAGITLLIYGTQFFFLNRDIHNLAKIKPRWYIGYEPLPYKFLSVDFHNMGKFKIMYSFPVDFFK